MKRQQIDRRDLARKAHRSLAPSRRRYLNEAKAPPDSVLAEAEAAAPKAEQLEEGLATQRRMLLAYTRWLTQRQRLTFAPERLVESYMAAAKSDADLSATRGC